MLAFPKISPLFPPFGSKDVNHAEREMVDEAEEIEQEAYIMTKPNREAHVEMVPFQKVSPLKVK